MRIVFAGKRILKLSKNQSFVVPKDMLTSRASNGEESTETIKSEFNGIREKNQNFRPLNLFPNRT